MNAHLQHAASAQAARIGQARVGIVSAVDPVAHAVKVRIQPEDVETGWLPDNTESAGGLRIASPTEIGTQVVVSPVDGNAEELTVTARMFDTIVQTPVSPVTGKPAQPGERLVMAGQPAPPAMDGGELGAATENAAWYHHTATAHYFGAGNASLTIMHDQILFKVGGFALALTTGGVAATGGTISSDMDVLAQMISLLNHRTTGVQAGSGLSGPPA